MKKKYLIVFLLISVCMQFSMSKEKMNPYDDPFVDPVGEMEVEKKMVVFSVRFEAGVSILVKNHRVDEAIEYLGTKTPLLTPNDVGAEVPIIIVVVKETNDNNEYYYLYLGEKDGYFSKSEVNEFLKKAGLDFVNLF